MSPDLAALVEKVARRLCSVDPNIVINGVPFWHHRREIALYAIRAVAEATQEPSEAMLTAAAGPSAFLARQFAEYNWTAMHAASVLGEALRHEG